MKLKLVLVAVALLGGLYAANRYLNSGPSSRGSLESEASGQREAREQFTVGFLPVT
jgi:hypothetical protein